MHDFETREHSTQQEKDNQSLYMSPVSTVFHTVVTVNIGLKNV